LQLAVEHLDNSETNFDVDLRVLFTFLTYLGGRFTLLFEVSLSFGELDSSNAT
jgi:hypothetical protein